MKIKVAPFANIAKPMLPGPLAKAYWQSDISVEAIAVRFSAKSGKAVRRAAGDAVLHGVCCKDCNEEIVCTSRDEAIRVIGDFESRGGSRVQCKPCWRVQKDSQYRERFRKFGAATERSAPRKEEKRTKRGPVTKTEKQDFYESWEWNKLRYQVLTEEGRICKCCGNRLGMFYASGEPVRIVVDHIKPISKHWHLRLERSNLQPLCDECNMGKGNWDETDFRSPEAPDEWLEEPQDDIALTVLAQMNGETVQ